MRDRDRAVRAGLFALGAVCAVLGACASPPATPPPVDPPSLAPVPTPVVPPTSPAGSAPSLAVSRLDLLRAALVVLPPPGDAEKLPKGLQDRLDTFVAVDLPTLDDPALDAWPRDVARSAAGLHLVDVLERVQEALPAGEDALAYLPAGFRASPRGQEILAHLVHRLHPDGLTLAGHLGAVPDDARQALDDLQEILADDLQPLCTRTPEAVARWPVLRALLEADAEIAEVDGMLALPPLARDPWRWVDPAFLRRCTPPG